MFSCLGVSHLLSTRASRPLACVYIASCAHDASTTRAGDELASCCEPATSWPAAGAFLAAQPHPMPHPRSQKSDVCPGLSVTLH